MNKQITLLILGVVLCAMGMIVYFHASSQPETGTPGMQAGSSSSGSGASGNATSAVNAGTEAGAGETAATGRSGASQGAGSSQGNELPRVDPPISSQSGQGGLQSGSSSGAQGPSAANGNQAAGTSGGDQTAGRPDGNQTAGTSESGRSNAAGAASGQGASGQTSSAATPVQASQTTTGQGSQSVGAQGANAGAAAVQYVQLPLDAKHNLKSIGLHFSGQRIFLRIEADDPFPCKTFALTGPERLVVDLPGVWTGMKAPAVPQNNIINGARYGVQKAGPRLVLDLGKSSKYEVTRPSPTVVEIYVQ